MVAGAVGTLALPDHSIVPQAFLSGLDQPVFIGHAGDGSGRLFVVEQTGKIKVVVGGQVLPTPFLDLTSNVVVTIEQGLLGLAFHPQFKTNGRFFVFYTAKPPPQSTSNAGDNVLAEYRVSPPGSNVADPVAVRTLIAMPDRVHNHNGGMLAFGPDSYLYVGTGDEGGVGDSLHNGQNLGVLFAKILRLDVDHAGSPDPPGFGYSIPPGNPFIGQAGVRPETWAYGFRNPWRWSFDRLTGDLLIGDVGQADWEEIDRLPAGLMGQSGRNFGWSVREGAHCNPPGTPSCSTSGLTDPILEYPHTIGCSVIGGYRYRGTGQPALQGHYFYADYCTGMIWKAAPFGSASGPWWSAEALDTAENVSSFGEDEAGELYVVGLGGSIFRLLQAAPQACPVRPRVVIRSVPGGPGTISATVSVTDNASAPNNELRSVSFNRITNALISIGAQVDRQSPFTATLPAGTRGTQFTVRRSQPGLPMQVEVVAVDRCGAWSSFVGAGTGLP